MAYFWKPCTDELRRKYARARDQAALLWRLYELIMPYKRWLVYAGIAMATTVALSVPAPLLTMFVIDRVLPSRNATLLCWIAALLVAILIVRCVAGYLQQYYLTRLKLRVLLRLRKAAVAGAMRASFVEVQQRHSAYITSRLAQDSKNAVSGLITQSLLTVIRNIITFIVGVGVLCALNGSLAALVLAFVPVLIVVMGFSSGKIRRTVMATLEADAQSTKVLGETFAGLYVVQAFARERGELRKNVHALMSLMRYDLRAFVIISVSSVISTFCTALGPCVVLVIGGLAVIRGGWTIGQLVAFSSYLSYVFGPTQEFSSLFGNVQQSLAAFQRVLEFVDYKVPDANTVGVRSTLVGQIEFSNVGFSYAPGAPVLAGVSIAIKAGEVVGIVGESGSGKTTVMNLIVRFFDPNEGVVRVDGRDVRAFDLRTLRQQIGVVPQEPKLFTGTIESNIRYGAPDAGIADVVRAARLANAEDFILRLKRGYQTEVGELGAGLSLGERQRICIARALLKEPKVLLLDEPTSAVDRESELRIKEALRDACRGRTCVIVTHREELLELADTVYELKDRTLVRRSYRGSGHGKERGVAVPLNGTRPLRPGATESEMDGAGRLVVR